MRQASILTAVFLTILLLSAASISWLLYKEISNSVDTELKTRHQSLALQIQEINIHALKLPVSPLFIASLTLKEGRLLGAQALSAVTHNGFVDIEFKGFDEQDDWRVYTAAIAQGQLSIAINTEQRYKILEKVNELFLVVGIITTVITLIIALYIGGKTQRRFSAINQTLDKIADGDLSARIAPTQHNDDVDQMAQHIDATALRLEALIKQTRDLSANISHDLKTPMARLRAKLESALSDKDSHSIELTLEAALDQTDQMIATFEAILRMAHLSSGQHRARFCVLSINTLVTETAEIFRAVIEDNGHQFLLSNHSNEMIKGDRELIIQLIANLLENALRHTPSGSIIALNCQGLQLSVADNGPGIAANLRQKVLEPMYRLDKSRHTKGNGLGLSMVDSIAELHRASIQLTDTYNTQPTKIIEDTNSANKRGLNVTVIFPSGA